MLKYTDMKTPKLDIIGRVEKADFPELGIIDVPVKIDTGAYSSSIWAHKIEVIGKKLYVEFFAPTSRFYTGKEFVFSPSEYKTTCVTNSFGHREKRYKVKLRINLNGKLIRGTFTLSSNRGIHRYKVLIGRKLLKGKFLVDVKTRGV